MKLATCRVRGDVRIGIVRGAVIALTESPDMIALIRESPDPRDLRDRVVAEVPLEQVELLAPVLRPGKILGSGINYRSHKDENPEAVMPVEPGFFSKLPSSVVGPEAEIRLPWPDAQVDYEVEFAVVIGSPGRDIAPSEAMSHVFGYTLINDVSARDVQFRPHQMDLGKGMDTFCPMGPWIVTADEIPDPGAVRLRSYVNGEIRQDASTAEWLFDIPAMIEHVSRSITLESGDVISTGTPAGCGTFRLPPTWLCDGDEVIVEADGIGQLRNRVVRSW